jgi:hypothetical protein
MRLLFTAILSACLLGCSSSATFETTVTNPDGSKTTTKIQTTTKNGTMTETKTETTVTPDSKSTSVVYEKKGKDWVKQGS